MNVNLTEKEMAFFCLMFERPLPQYMDNPFESTPQEQMHQEWLHFIRDFGEKGLLQFDEEENAHIEQTLLHVLMGVLEGDATLSLMNEVEENTQLIFYKKQEYVVMVSRNDDIYTFSLIEGMDAFNVLFLEVIGIEPNSRTEPIEAPFYLKTDANAFEQLLEKYETGRPEFTTVAEQYNADATILKNILDELHHAPSRTTVTERTADESGTILMKLIPDSSKITIAKTIYTDQAVSTVLAQCPPEKLGDMIFDFEEKRDEHETSQYTSS